MQHNPRREPLYRKVNTRTWGVHHRSGSDYRHTRNTKREADSDLRRGPMYGGHRRGLDYTPLFRFLLSKVGGEWDEIYSEAVPRLDRPDPIFWLVARTERERKDVVLLGESSYYSGLYVDGENRLRLVNPALGPGDIVPGCTCCTHTFNGVVVPRRAPAGGRGGYEG